MAGETLAVLGAAGGSGVTAVQLGHALGARVVAVGTGGRATRAAVAGSAPTCSSTGRPRTSPPPCSRRRTAEAPTLVYDPVGGELAGQALAGLATGGRFLAVGFASGEWVQAETHELVLRNQSLVGVYAGGHTREEDEADHEALLALRADGRLQPFATAHPFDELPAATTAVADGTAIGKQVLELSALVVRGEAVDEGVEHDLAGRLRATGGPGQRDLAVLVAGQEDRGVAGCGRLAPLVLAPDLEVDGGLAPVGEVALG